MNPSTPSFLWRATRIIVLLVVVAGCETSTYISSFPNGPTLVGLSTGSLSGLVIDRFSGQPIAGSRISASPNWQLPFRVGDWPPRELSTVISGSDGRFTFFGLPHDLPFWIFPRALSPFSADLLQRCGVNVLLPAAGGTQVFTLSSSFDNRHPLERALAALPGSCGFNEVVILTP